MTLHVVAMNQLGVAIASDSMLSISGFHSQVADEKIIPLGAMHPVAVLSSGGAQHKGVYWNLQIDQWAKQLESPFEELKDYPLSLIDYLRSHESDSAGEADAEVVEGMTLDVLRRAVVEVQGSGNEIDRSTLAAWLDEESKRLTELSKDVDWTVRTAEAFAAAHRESMRRAWGRILPARPSFAPTVRTDAALRRWLTSSLRFGSLSNNASTLVFVGYAAGYWAPEIAILQVDGDLGSKLRWMPGAREHALRHGLVRSYGQDSGIIALLGGSAARLDESVTHLPPRALLNIARSLVGVESLRQSLIENQASVGGPIDLAFIDYRDGFSWISRSARDFQTDAPLGYMF